MPVVITIKLRLFTLSLLTLLSRTAVAAGLSFAPAIGAYAQGQPTMDSVEAPSAHEEMVPVVPPASAPVAGWQSLDPDALVPPPEPEPTPVAVAVDAATVAPGAKPLAHAAGEATPVAIDVAPVETEEQVRARLNAEQAAFARKQAEETAANQRAYEEALVAREAEIQRQQQAYQDETARLAREHDAAMARWRADAEACKKGDRSRCAPKQQ